jgi:2-keto-4-pentenoate hydratase/2-oxohepta-3-ene-1,7-dioic acid hydratase in catechol pathway
LHAQELGNAVPSSPFLFSKPTHALVAANGQTIELPADRGEIHHEVEFVIHIGKAYEPGMRVDELVDQMAIGIDFTLRDVQSELKKKGYPWLLAKGFIRSAVLSAFIPFPGITQAAQKDFALLKNGEQVQRGNIKDMLFDLETIVAFTARHFGLGKGDIIFTGTPAGVGPVANEDRLALVYGDETLGECTIRLV